MLQKSVTPILLSICLLPVQTPHTVTLIWVFAWYTAVWTVCARIDLFLFVFLILLLRTYLALVYRIHWVFDWWFQSSRPVWLRVWHLVWVLRHSGRTCGVVWYKILKLLPCFHNDLIQKQVITPLKFHINLWKLVLKPFTSWAFSRADIFIERNIPT